MREVQPVRLSDNSVKIYTVKPTHKPLISWKLYGTVFCDGKVIGEFCIPRNFKESQQHHCLVSWIMADCPDVVEIL